MEQKNRILIVEDDTDINNLLYTALLTGWIFGKRDI